LAFAARIADDAGERSCPVPPIKHRPGSSSAEIHSEYDNRSLGPVNDHEIRMSVMTQPYRWHSHPDSDEVFVGVDGELVIEFRDGDVILGPGELITVPKGVEHRTRPLGARSVNLTFERQGASTEFADAQD
jgi:mannose-6-phosphate isomerase-like protein (cupin superfamily)